MHHVFPDVVQDDTITLTYEGNVYKCRKGTWADKQFFLDCHEDEPLEEAQERICQSLVDWNILSPKETEMGPGDREAWFVFSKNDVLFGSFVYTCYQEPGYTGKFKVTDMYIGILPAMRGQGLMKFMTVISDYIGRNGGLDLQGADYSIMDTATPALKQAVNTDAIHLEVEKKFKSTSHRFRANDTGVSAYWAEKGFTDEMFTWTRGTSLLTDSKWATELVKLHLKEILPWNDPSRFSKT